MLVVVADTHAIIWYFEADQRLSTAAKSFIEITAANNDTIAISAITLVEMVYLIEKNRIPAQRFSQLAEELRDSESLFVEIPVDVKIARALTRVDVAQVPDMPDRIIAATALHLQIPVISRDSRIKLSSVSTIW